MLWNLCWREIVRHFDIKGYPLPLETICSVDLRGCYCHHEVLLYFEYKLVSLEPCYCLEKKLEYIVFAIKIAICDQVIQLIRHLLLIPITSFLCPYRPRLCQRHEPQSPYSHRAFLRMKKKSIN